MKRKLFALLMALVMVLSLAACGGSGDSGTSGDSGSTGGTAAEGSLHVGYSLAEDKNYYGPYYDEWSDMTDEELYEMALK